MRGAEFFVLLGLLAFVSLILSPILAIRAWHRVRRLEQKPTSNTDPALPGRVSSVELKLAELADKLASLEAARSATAPTTVEVRTALTTVAPSELAPSLAITPDVPVAPRAAPTPPLLPPVPALVRPATPRQRVEGDMETTIAGRWLNRIGILAVVIGLAFFLKYAFDNHWIGPTGQVAIGVLFGAGLLVFSQWLLNRGYQYFSEGIAGMGACAMYLSLWAACNHYSPPVFSKEVAFVAMIVVTAAMLVIAVGRDSESIALLALLGGFATPWLVSTGQDAQVVLFTYVAVLNAGVLALAFRKVWRWLEIPALGFTLIYFWAWHGHFYNSEKLLVTVAFATLFFTQFAALPVIRTRLTGKLFEEQLVLVLLNAGAYLIALRVLLWPEHRWELTIAVLALAAAHLFVAQLVPRREAEMPVTRLLYTGLALTFVTLAVPIRLEGRWITIAWAVEGAVLMWTGFRARLWQLRGAGFAIFVLVLLRLLAFPIDAHEFLLNARFATFAVTIAAFGFTLWVASQNKEQLRENELGQFGALGVAINVLAVWALSLEVYNYFAPAQPGLRLDFDAELAQQLALSLLWITYAAVLIVLGVRTNVSLLRWQALALFGLVIMKVFFYDLSFLSGMYRILSSTGLGVVLLVVSFLYQRKLAAMKAREEK